MENTRCQKHDVPRCSLCNPPEEQEQQQQEEVKKPGWPKGKPRGPREPVPRKKIPEFPDPAWKWKKIPEFPDPAWKCPKCHNWFIGVDAEHECPAKADEERLEAWDTVVATASGSMDKIEVEILVKAVRILLIADKLKGRDLAQAVAFVRREKP